jgi:hypothetical protein
MSADISRARQGSSQRFPEKIRLEQGQSKIVSFRLSEKDACRTWNRDLTSLQSRFRNVQGFSRGGNSRDVRGSVTSAAAGDTRSSPAGRAGARQGERLFKISSSLIQNCPGRAAHFIPPERKPRVISGSSFVSLVSCLLSAALTSLSIVRNLVSQKSISSFACSHFVGKCVQLNSIVFDLVNKF